MLYEVTRTRHGEVVDRYMVHASGGLHAIALSKRDDLDDDTLCIHAFARGEGADKSRDCTRFKGQLILLG